MKINGLLINFLYAIKVYLWHFFLSVGETVLMHRQKLRVMSLAENKNISLAPEQPR
jgi:hypothetical protein